MNKTTSALIAIVLVIMVIVSIFGLYSGSLESVEGALMGDDGSLFDNAQNPDGTTYESPDPTSNSFENNYRLEVV